MNDSSALLRPQGNGSLGAVTFSALSTVICVILSFLVIYKFLKNFFRSDHRRRGLKHSHCSDGLNITTGSCDFQEEVGLEKEVVFRNLNP